MIKLIIVKKKKKCSGLGEDATVSNEPFQRNLRKIQRSKSAPPAGE